MIQENHGFTEEESAELFAEWIRMVKQILKQSESFQSLNRGEGLALLLLEDHDQGLSPGELCESMTLTSGRMSNILRQLESKGYIDRHTDPTNHRKSVIAITPNGERYIDDLSKRAQQHMRTMSEKLGPDDFHELTRIIKKLIATTDEHDT